MLHRDRREAGRVLGGRLAGLATGSTMRAPIRTLLDQAGSGPRLEPLSPEARTKEDDMLCREIMKRHVHCVSPNDTAQSVARTMLDENVGFLPVCENGKPIGTITDRDLSLRLVAGGLAHTTRIAEIMTREVVSCRPHDDVREAEKQMAGHHKSRIMCVDGDGRLVGVISLSDLAEKDRRHVADTLAEVSSRESHT